MSAATLEADSSGSTDTLRALQRSTGLVVAVSSGVIASLLFFRFTTDLDMRPSAALVDPYLLSVVFFGLLALWSGLAPPVVGQSAQLASMFVVALLAASTARAGELTPLIFFGLVTGYGTVYRPVTRHSAFFFVPVTVFFLGVWFLRIITLTGGIGIDLMLSFVAASMVVTLLSILVWVQVREQKTREQRLENKVQERTQELSRAVVRSEEFSERNAALLREVHHRTKNNLQVVASLFSLQTFEKRLIDPFALRVIETAAARIQIMADIHEIFHHSDRNSVVDTRFFVTETVNSLVRSGMAMTVCFTDTDTAVDPETAAEPNTIDLDQAIPFGLLLNEIGCMRGDSDVVRTIGLNFEVRSSPAVMVLTITPEDQRLLEGVRGDDSITMQIILALVQQLEGTLNTEDVEQGFWQLLVPWRPK